MIRGVHLGTMFAIATFVPALLSSALFSSEGLGGVFGNLLASAIWEYRSMNVLPLPLRSHTTKLPANHDLERIAMECMRQTIQYGGESVASTFAKPRSVLQKLFPVDRLAAAFGASSASPEDRWVNALVKSSWDAGKLAELNDGESFAPTENLADLFDPSERGRSGEITKAFAARVDAWARKHAGEPPPEQWKHAIQHGFLAERAPERRISLLDVWMLFMREALKTDQRAFRAWIIGTLTDLRSGLKPEAAAELTVDDTTADRLVKLIEAQFDHALRDQRAWMGEQFAHVRLELDQLREHCGRIEMKLDKLLGVFAPHQPGEAGWEKSGEAIARAALAVKESGTEQKAGGTPATGTTKEQAVQTVAERLEVEPKTVELALKEYASKARREARPSPTQRELAKKVERQFNIRPAASTSASNSGTGFGGFLLVVAIFVGLRWFNRNQFDIYRWMNEHLKTNIPIPAAPGEWKPSQPGTSPYFPQ